MRCFIISVSQTSLVRHTTSESGAALSQVDSFIAFRETGKACDADNDEEMDCD